MKEKQILFLLGILKSEYENSYKDFDTVVATWTSMFRDDDYDLTSRAIKRYIETNTTGFKPSIGQIKDLALQIKKEEWHKVHDKNPQLEAPKEELIPMPDDIKEKINNLFRMPI